MQLTLTQATNHADWDEFWRHSPEGSVFCQSAFLAAFAEPTYLYFVCDEGEPMLALPVLPERPLYLPYAKNTTVRFSLYQGPMFAAKVAALAPHSSYIYKMRLLEFALEQLSERYKQLTFGLDPRFDDLRAIQWFNYHNEAGGRFDVHLRYTGVLDLTSPAEQDQLKTFRNLRKREVLRAIKDGIIFEETDDIEVLANLIELNYQYQGSSSFEDNESMILRSVWKAASEHGFGKIFLVRDGNGVAISSALYLFDNEQAYYLFAGNHPDFRKLGASSYMISESIIQFRKMGLKSLDFVGINNPNWGDYKLSFNASPKSYFITTWVKPR